jgi:hypothetical protein
LPNIIKQETKKTDTAARIKARAILPIQIKKETPEENKIEFIN